MIIFSLFRLLFFFVVFLVLINIVRLFFFFLKAGLFKNNSKPGQRPAGGTRPSGNRKIIELDKDQYHVDE